MNNSLLGMSSSIRIYRSSHSRGDCPWQVFDSETCYFMNVGKKVSGKKVSGKKVSEKKNPEKKYQEKNMSQFHVQRIDKRLCNVILINL